MYIDNVYTYKAGLREPICNNTQGGVVIKKCIDLCREKSALELNYLTVVLVQSIILKLLWSENTVMIVKLGASGPVNRRYT